MFTNVMNNGRHLRQSIEGVYISCPCPECSFAYLTEDGYRVMIHTMASGCKDGQFHNEDAVTLYGYRVVDSDGKKGVIITNVIESSPQSERSSVTFDEDYSYAIHRDAYLRDIHVNSNYGVLGSCHMHPPTAHYFSMTDLLNFSMYLDSQKYYVAGLFHLENNELRLTMRVCARDPHNANRLLMWDLPTAISDSDVYNRMPPEGKKTNEQIWKEVARCRVAPRFIINNNDPRIKQINEIQPTRRESVLKQDMKPEMKQKEGTDAESIPAHTNSPQSQNMANIILDGHIQDGISIDISDLKEGVAGALCCILKEGVLRLFNQSIEANRSDDQDFEPMTVEPPASLRRETAVSTAENEQLELPSCVD